MKSEIIPILMRRDGMSLEDATDLWKEMRQRIRDGEDPEEVLHDEVGLEPDYIWELM